MPKQAVRPVPLPKAELARVSKMLADHLVKTRSPQTTRFSLMLPDVKGKSKQYIIGFDTGSNPRSPNFLLGGAHANPAEQTCPICGDDVEEQSSQPLVPLATVPAGMVACRPCGHIVDPKQITERPGFIGFTLNSTAPWNRARPEDLQENIAFAIYRGLIHELTHAREYQRASYSEEVQQFLDRMDNGPPFDFRDPADQEAYAKGVVAYHNDPFEVRAFMQSVVDDVEDTLSLWMQAGLDGPLAKYRQGGDLPVTNTMVQDLLSNSVAWMTGASEVIPSQVSSSSSPFGDVLGKGGLLWLSLKPENRRLMTQAVYRTVSNRLEKFKQQHGDELKSGQLALPADRPGPDLPTVPIEPVKPKRQRAPRKPKPSPEAEMKEGQKVAILNGEAMLEFRTGGKLYPYCDRCVHIAWTPISHVKGCTQGDDADVKDYSRRLEGGETDDTVEHCPMFSPIDVPEGAVGPRREAAISQAVMVKEVPNVSQPGELDDLFDQFDQAGVGEADDNAAFSAALRILTSWQGGLLSQYVTDEFVHDTIAQYRAARGRHAGQVR